MTAPDRGWGIAPEPGVRFHWSARAILRGGEIDLLHDRQGIEGEASPEERAALLAWLNTKAMPLVRADARTIDSGDRMVYSVEGDGYSLRYSPNGSYGYLYFSAHRAPEITRPTPELPAPKKTRGIIRRKDRRP